MIKILIIKYLKLEKNLSMHYMFRNDEMNKNKAR